MIIFSLITLALGYSATQLRVDADFNKMIPLQHPYMKTFTHYQQTFGGANRVLVVLMQKNGDIFNADFFNQLKQVTDDVFFIPWVDRATVTSLFTPNVRFIEVVEEGFAGGNVIPANFSGTTEDLETVRKNILKSGTVGRLVSNNFNGALISANLLEINPNTDPKLDYQAVAKQLENIRSKYQNDKIDVHIIGFAKAVGDISNGARDVIVFFALAFIITTLLLYFYAGSTKLTLLALICALMPVIWLLGLLPIIGLGIDPMSILVPFLIFSIGVSHAVQMTNAWKLEAIQGTDGLTAAHRAFSTLFIPGSVALLTNALGFMVIIHIKIVMVQELAITASMGVLLMIVTNKLLLPVLLSYLHLSDEEKQKNSRTSFMTVNIWRAMSHFAQPRAAIWVLLISSIFLVLGTWKARELKIGDLGKGIPELHDTSRYNRDNAAITNNFSIGVDVLSVIVQSHDAQGACTNYNIMDNIDRLEWHMRHTEGVQSVLSLPGMAKIISAGWNEGNLKWRALSRDSTVLAQSVTPVDTSSGLLNSDCSAMQMMIFTRDHQGETIAHIINEIKKFSQENNSRQNNTEKITFLLASGNVGVMAATNEAVAAAEMTMLLSIFGAIILLCLITFRSWQAALCIVIPLALVSVLCNALMAMLDIGLKVSTLPVVALGVGVGVDYGIYLFERIKHEMQTHSLSEAFYQALKQRGTAAIFTALTMSIGVGSWAFSALKFQSDMGILLAFMFLVNMLGAILLLPALAAYLLKSPSKQVS